MDGWIVEWMDGYVSLARTCNVQVACKYNIKLLNRTNGLIFHILQ